MDFQKRNITTTMFAITAFLYKDAKQVMLTTTFPSWVKFISLLQKLFSPTLIPIYIEAPRIFLFDAVRLYFTQLL
jgi:hypothetical protein